MDNFNFCRPTDFYFGRGEERRVGEICKKYGATKVLVHFGGQSARKSGLLARVEESLSQAGLAYVELGGVLPNPRAELVYTGIDLCRREGVNLVLGVGGGSVLDSAKAIANGTLYDGDFWDYYSGGKAPERALPVGAVLTIAAAGSEGSCSAVIEKAVNGVIKKIGINLQTNVPAFAVMNPELTETLPPFQTACGACDIMCHVIERYFTNSKEVELTDRLCEAVMATMVSMLPRVMRDPHDYEARANIMWASTVAHNNSCGVDREQDWASHRIEHELSALYDCAHGAGLAVITPAWMEEVMDHDVMRFAQFGHRVFGCPMNFAHPEITARAGIAALRALWGAAGLPLSLGALGARVEDIPTLLDNLCIDTKPQGHFVVLHRPEVEAILRRAAAYGKTPAGR